MSIAIRRRPPRAPWPRVTCPSGEAALAGRALFRGGSDDLIGRLQELVDDGGRHLVMTPNVDQVLSLRDGGDARRAFDRASLLLADGAPLVALARLLGDRAVRRLTGADLLGAAVAAAAVRGWTVAIAGGDAAVAAEAAARLSAAHPAATVSSVPFPQLRGADDAAGAGVVDALRRLRPQLVFLCLGSPKQEGWFLRWEQSLPDAVYVGAGAAVEFAAGVRSRAPRVVQRLGAEWVWRLVQEPRRLARRYLVKGPGFLSVIAVSLTAARVRGPR